MRILVLTNMYPPHHLGGYELACRDAVARWRSKGHDVSILTTDVTFAHATGDDDPDVARELKMYWRDGLIVSPPPWERFAIEQHNAKVLDRMLATFRPDAVSVWHMGGMSLASLTTITRLRLPMVLAIYDDWLVYGQEVDAWMRVFRSRPGLASIVGRLTGLATTVELDGDAAVVCFMSQWLRDRAAQRSPLTLPREQAIVYGGIDLNVFGGGDTPRPWRWRLLCAGRVEQRKGVHVAIEALGLMPPQATLDIVGTPDDETYIRQLRRRADELGIAERVHWAGPVSRTELAQHFRETDVFVFPVVWDEPFGMVPLEAMACGAAVIGTGTGGSNEFLHHEVNCLRVDRGDPAQIAAAARRLADDAELRTRLVQEGRATAGRFSDLRYYDELEAWLVRQGAGPDAGGRA